MIFTGENENTHNESYSFKVIGGEEMPEEEQE